MLRGECVNVNALRQQYRMRRLPSGWLPGDAGECRWMCLTNVKAC